ncbi:MAG: TrmH family RNA methyltransferase [Anaerolineae bacterium]
MPVMGCISSLENEQIKHVRSLAQGHTRKRYGHFVLEGFRLVQTAVESHYPLHSILASESFAKRHPDFMQALSAGDVAAWLVQDAILTSLADTSSPQGIISVAMLPTTDPTQSSTSTLLVLLDNIRDPGNLGTILRTAQATGAGCVLLSPGCVDAFAPKVVRSAMGAHLHLSLVEGKSWSEIAEMCAGRPAVLADAAGQATYWELDWTLPVTLIICNEAFGPSFEARQLAERTTRLPMVSGAESLNAAIAAGVLLYEIFKQRQLKCAR